MNVKRIIERKKRILGACLAAVMAWAFLTASPASYAQTTPANLSPDLQEIVKFAQAHMTDDVILAYIKNSGKVYNLSGDDMIYLKQPGSFASGDQCFVANQRNAAPAQRASPFSCPNPAACRRPRRQLPRLPPLLRRLRVWWMFSTATPV